MQERAGGMMMGEMEGMRERGMANVREGELRGHERGRHIEHKIRKERT